jgi:hypothetical protein
MGRGAARGPNSYGSAVFRRAPASTTTLAEKGGNSYASLFSGERFAHTVGQAVCNETGHE